MTQPSRKPNSVAIGTALAGGLLLSGGAFAVTPLAQGYALGAQEAATAATTGDKAKEGACGADKTAAEGKCGEGKCGEGKCGADNADTDGDGRISRAEFEAAHPEKSDGFAAIDSNGDGFIDQEEHAAHKAAGKAGMEGKCGEGRCGGAA